MLVVVAVAVGTALGVSAAIKPTYSATAKVLLQQSAGAQALGAGIVPVATTPNSINDEIAILRGPGVASLVRRQIGSAPGVSASNEASTDIIDVTAGAPTAKGAARIANAYADAFVSYLRNQNVDALLSAASAVQGRITALEAEISSLQSPVAHSGQQPSPSPSSQPASSAQTVTALDQQLVVLEQQLSTLQSDAALGSAGAQVVQPAEVPSSPSSPKTVRNALLGLLGGVVLGIGLAFVRESLDDTIVSRDDLDHAQPELPVLAQIPRFSGRGSELVSVARPHSDAAEAYRSLRTSVQFSALDRSLRTLQLTSPRAAEGKTTTVGNLAVALAQAGQRVVIVDCDLRRSRIHRLFGLSNQVGFTSVMLGEVPLSTALQEVPGQPNLRLLASGAHPHNPSELLAGQRASEVIASLAEVADLVVIDSPPVLPVTDAVALAPRMDATLVVVQSGFSTAKDLARALELLGQVGAGVIGCVLNSVPPPGRYGYRYGSYRYGDYSYSYRSSDERGSRRQGAHVQTRS